MFLIQLFLFLFIHCQLCLVRSDCPTIELCDCDIDKSQVICDGNQTETSTYFTSFSLLPSVEKYIFRNFKTIQPYAFENMTFLSNHAITIQLINIAIIHTDAFSTGMLIPDNSTVSIDIEFSSNPSTILLQQNAFNNVKINRLTFFNVNYFNGSQIFNTDCFGEQLYIEKLIFQQCSLTGFTNVIGKYVDVKQLHIVECAALTQLTNKNLPSFISTTESLEISNTGLETIDDYTFQEESLLLKELIIRNNTKLNSFSRKIVNGIFKNLDLLDLSYNPIRSLDQDFNWSAFSSVKDLILKQQSLELYLETDILKTLTHVRTIDFSEGFIREHNEDFISNHIIPMSNLLSMNISHTNLTERMIINLLECLSTSINQTINISLLGYTLNDSNLCSYLSIVNKSSNLFQIELDETHECNCVVNLLYKNENVPMMDNSFLKRPMCLFNTTRELCTIQSNCPLKKPNPNGSGAQGLNGSSNGFIGYIIGFGAALLALLVLGSAATYRRRRRQRTATIEMEYPIENPLTAIVENPLQH